VSRASNWEVVVGSVGIEAANCLFQVNYPGQKPKLSTHCEKLREALDMPPGSNKYSWLRQVLDPLMDVWFQSVSQRVEASLSSTELFVEMVYPMLLMPVHSEALCGIDHCKHGLDERMFRGISLISTYARRVAVDGKMLQHFRRKLPKKFRTAETSTPLRMGELRSPFLFSSMKSSLGLLINSTMIWNAANSLAMCDR
jgi:hypothetical protein